MLRLRPEQSRMWCVCSGLRRSFEMAAEKFSNTNRGEVLDVAQVTALSAGLASALHVVFNIYVVFRTVPIPTFSFMDKVPFFLNDRGFYCWWGDKSTQRLIGIHRLASDIPGDSSMNAQTLYDSLDGRLIHLQISALYSLFIQSRFVSAWDQRPRTRTALSLPTGAIFTSS